MGTCCEGYPQNWRATIWSSSTPHILFLSEGQGHVRMFHIAGVGRHGWWQLWGHDSRGMSKQRTLPPNFGMKSSRDGLRLALVLTRINLCGQEGGGLGWGTHWVRPSRWAALPQPNCRNEGGSRAVFPRRGEGCWTCNSPDVHNPCHSLDPWLPNQAGPQPFYLWSETQRRSISMILSQPKYIMNLLKIMFFPYSFLTCMRIKYLC